VFDGFTLRNLEVFQSLSTQGTHGTLLDALDETVTAGGGRLLKQWLNQPLAGLSRLNIRQNIVEAFVQKKKSLHAIRNYLGKISDLERILGKISRLKATPRDVWGLGSSLGLIPFLKKDLEDSGNKALAELSSQFKDLKKTVKLIVEKVKEDAPVSLKRGGFIIQGVDKELDELRSLSSGGKQWISDLQNSEREATRILKI
jgi:DNA mismatch repair protein MutS